MWKRFGSLVRISNQASEACNWHHDKIVKWLGRQGGFGKPQAEELIEHRLVALLFMLQSKEQDIREWLQDNYNNWLQQCRAARARSAEKLSQQRAFPQEDISTQTEGIEDEQWGKEVNAEDERLEQEQRSLHEEQPSTEENISEESFSEEEEEQEYLEERQEPNFLSLSISPFLASNALCGTNPSHSLSQPVIPPISLPLSSNASRGTNSFPSFYQFVGPPVSVPLLGNASRGANPFPGFPQTIAPPNPLPFTNNKRSSTTELLHPPKRQRTQLTKDKYLDGWGAQ